ncbi:hypothetical protein D3C72_2011960 [compost metagenome]
MRQTQRAHQEFELSARQGVFDRCAVGTNAEVRFVWAVRGIGQHAVAFEASLQHFGIIRLFLPAALEGEGERKLG